MLLVLLGCPAPVDTAVEDSAKPAEAEWNVLAQGMDAAPLSVFGTGSDDVWIVGSDAGAGPVWAHWDGLAWSTFDLAGSGDLWWVYGDTEALWLAGAAGRIFRYDRGAGTVDAYPQDPTVTFYGIWGDDEAWAVGGNPDAAADTAAMYHFVGGTWSKIDLPPEAAAQLALYKVWGSSSTDVWAVGTGGVTVHWDGTSWSNVPTDVTANLFTVHGRYAVGGNAAGALLAWSGSQWVEETPAMSYPLAGVWDDGANTPIAVGQQGGVYLRGEQGWEKDPAPSNTFQDLHSTWVSPEGERWAVGGHIASLPLIHGVVLHFGQDTVSPLEGL